jgi:RND family efflux transporter MFP subunit
MHPGFKSDRPGTAPCCGMALEPVYAESAAASSAPSRSLPPGTIQVSSGKQQLIGVHTGVVEKSGGSRMLRLLGRVAADELRVFRVRAAVDGWIQEVYHNTVGSLVKKGQPLASYYAPEFLTAEQTYLLAVDSLERFHVTGQETPSQIKLSEIKLLTALDDLRNLGMDEAQIDELTHTRKFTRNIMIRAPETGFVLVREVSPGERIEKGGELYRIAELSRVWIIADIYENEGRHFRPGAVARVSHPHLGREYEARVSEVLPLFDPETRTLKIRLETDNPGYLLRPDMFVDVEFPLNLPATIAVPSEAVLDAGIQKTVFVDLGDGYFEPRRVETGWRMNGKVEITEGLKEGERIVVSGNFLLDSESRLKAAASGSQSNSIDPVCGMGVNPAEAGDNRSVYKGETYYFCAAQCKEAFDKEPERYLKKKAAETETTEKAAQAKDPVCRMNVDPAAEGVQKSEYKGKSYYFCCSHCKEKFDKDPEQYLSGKTKAAAAPPSAQPSAKKQVTDPVCGMAVDTAAAGVLKSEYKGRTYHFCSDFCRVKFEKEPERFLGSNQVPGVHSGVSGDAFSVGDIVNTRRESAVKIGAESYNDIVMAEVMNRKRYPNFASRSETMQHSAEAHAEKPEDTKEAADGREPTRDPVCAKEVDPAASTTVRFTYQGSTYHFCSTVCRDKFMRERAELRRRDAEAAGIARNLGSTPRANPREKYEAEAERFLYRKQMEAAMASSAGKIESARDPVCGMDVNITAPGVLKSRRDGKTYYFCSESCKESFEKAEGKK